MTRPLRVDYPSVHHPREANCVVALCIEGFRVLPVEQHAYTHNVDKFLNLAYSLSTDLTHLERYERAELVALQKSGVSE
jgi:hypothetical protein